MMWKLLFFVNLGTVTDQRESDGQIDAYEWPAATCGSYN